MIVDAHARCRKCGAETSSDGCIGAVLGMAEMFFTLHVTTALSSSCRWPVTDCGVEELELIVAAWLHETIVGIDFR